MAYKVDCKLGRWFWLYVELQRLLGNWRLIASYSNELTLEWDCCSRFQMRQKLSAKIDELPSIEEPEEIVPCYPIPPGSVIG